MSRPTGSSGTASSGQCQTPYRTRETQERIQELQWELLEHLPYTLDLASSDFHLVSPLKKDLSCKRFADDKEVKTEVRKWPRQQSKDFYAVGFDAPVE
jgi:hypothetical protein